MPLTSRLALLMALAMPSAVAAEQPAATSATVTPIDLATVEVAVALRDDVAGDGKGGWTDQGDNDLRVLPPGPLLAAGIPFTVGAGALVVADGRVPGRTASATVAAAGRHGSWLYLLHASAWTPRGEVVIGKVGLRFADGSSEEREVRSQREVADWWNPPDRLSAAALGWSGRNAQASVGLYVARLAVPDRPLAGITFAAANGAVWMVAGLALGGDLPLRFPAPEVLVAGPRWLPAVPAEIPWEVAAGSALDLGGSGPATAPGRLVARGGDLVREGGDGTPVRLLGANLCFSANYPDKAQAERMAVAFRRMGYNAVRFHHQDGALVPSGGDGSTLDPAKLDQLDWLAACCRREGLWFTTDLYVSRNLPKGAIPELPELAAGREMKALIPLLPSALANWKGFATAFLTHRNPYTGLTWGEDPALATLSLVNEDNLPSVIGSNPRVKELYERRFAEWLAGRPAAEQAAAGPAGAAREQARGRWLCGLQAAAYDAMRVHVRGVGVRAPTTGINWQTDWWSLAVRDGLDLVDNHSYHDHPGFPGKPFQLPMAYNQRSAVGDLLRVPAGLAQTRRLDRPFTVSEIQYCPPNHHRAEYAAGVAAVAGLQGWSGVWRFAFAHNIALVARTSGGIAGFDIPRDPVGLLGERAMALLYRRGDVVAAPTALALVYDPPVSAGRVGRQPPAELAALALHERVGCLPVAGAAAAVKAVPGLRALIQDPNGGMLPADARPALPVLDGTALPAALATSRLIPAAEFDLARPAVRSATGQIACDAAAGLLTIATPRSVAAVLPAGASVTLSGVTLANPDSEPATVVLAALDERPLDSSRRLLLLHLTDAQTSGIRFASPRHALVEDWGSGPVLIRAGALRVELSGTGGATAWALDLAGGRHDSVVAAGRRLDLAVARPWGPCLAWEVVRE